MEKNIFKYLKKDNAKLLEYGFIKEQNKYIYSTNLMNNKFILKVTIDDKVIVDVIDTNTFLEYLPFYTNSSGSFVGLVREEVDNILNAIAENCFTKENFKSKEAHEIINYIAKKYQHKPEYLWKKTPNNAIFRNEKNKWYAVILTANKKVLGLNEDIETEMLNLKINPKNIENIVDNKNIFPAYHMNKKHWITILLNEEMPLEEIFEYIDNSYELTLNKKPSRC